MGRTRLLLVASLIYILLSGEVAVATESASSTTPRNDDDDGPATGNPASTTTQSPDKEPGKPQVYGVVQGNDVFFNWSQTPESLPVPVYQIRYKTKLLACSSNGKYTPWVNLTDSSKTVTAKPYNNVTLEVRIAHTNESTAKSVVTPGKVPTTKVTHVKANSRHVQATLNNDCSGYNGPGMSVQFVLKETNKNGSNIIKKHTNIKGGTAKLKWKGMNLLPFTSYTVTAIPSNSVGEAADNSLFKETTFKTDPGKPGKVRNLKVVNASPDSLKVEWSAPDDDPPTGILEKYIVYYGDATLTAGGKTKYINGNTTSLVIRGVNPDSVYNITVKAKNKYQNTPSDPVQVNGSTTQGRAPFPVVGLNSMPETNTTTLYLTWSPFGIDTVALYMVSLYHEETLKMETNTTNTTAKFDHLTAGKNYVVRVRACNKEGECSNTTETVAWTRPDPPKVTETNQTLPLTDGTLTMQLPTLENPPGTHRVLLKKDDGESVRYENWTENIKEEALTIVRQERLNKRTRRSLDRGPHNYNELKIIKTIEVKEGWDTSDKTVQLEKAAKLKSGCEYVVVVVTEKAAGDYSEFYTCDPLIFKTPSHKEEMKPLWLILGICAVAVVLVVILTLLVVRCKNRRRKIQQVEDNIYCMEGPVLQDVVQDNDTIPLTDSMNGTLLTEEHTRKMKEEQRNGNKQGLDKHVVEEDLYGNINHEVKLKDLEMYLPKAMFSAETKLEFNSIPFYMPGKTAFESLTPENVRKNRYKNEVCYDDTRVKIPLFNNIPHSDYINANFVQDPSHRASFIATQGPKDHNENTIGAFWRMIWHTKCSMILMVANLVEGGKAKVAQYWPETQPLVKEGVKVTLTSVRIVMDFVVRTFTLVFDDMEREVTQYQYTAWPDHGVPQTAYGLGHMLKIVIRDYAEGPGGPITVHCSAGIGRTGTIILTLFLLRQLETFNAINPREALLVLRKGRGRLVENMEQYIFVHKLLNEILFGMKTTFPCDSFVQEVAALRSSRAPDGTPLLQKQFQKIKDLPKDLTFKFGKDPTCAHLNRNQAILPADNRMVFVQMRGQGVDAQYLNVININGFDRKDAYLAGEHPQPHTLAKVWRLVFERQVSVWILLQQLPRNDPSFPNVVGECSSLPHNMTVTASQPRRFDNFTEYSVTLTVKEMGSSKRHQCTVLMVKGWSHAARLPPSPATLLGAIEKAESLLSPQTQLLFTCSDGVTGCGVMAALLLAMSKAKLTQEVDLYRSVVSVQYDRPQFIVDLEQYQFLHTAMCVYLDTNKHYGNFA